MLMARALPSLVFLISVGCGVERKRDDVRTTKPEQAVTIDRATMDNIHSAMDMLMRSPNPTKQGIPATKQQLYTLLVSSRDLLRDEGSRVTADLRAQWSHAVDVATTASAGSDTVAIATAYTELQQATNAAAEQMFSKATPVQVR